MVFIETLYVYSLYMGLYLCIVSIIFIKYLLSYGSSKLKEESGSTFEGNEGKINFWVLKIASFLVPRRSPSSDISTPGFPRDLAIEY